MAEGRGDRQQGGNLEDPSMATTPNLLNCLDTDTDTRTYIRTCTQNKSRSCGDTLRGYPLEHCHLQSLTLSLTTLRNLRERERQAQLQASSSHPNKRKQTSMLSHFPWGWALPGGLSHHTGVSEGEVLSNMTHLLAQEGH